MTRLLAMLLRKSPDIQLELNHKIVSSIEALQAALDDPLPKPTIIKNACINLLFRIWSRVWSKTGTNSLGDPTVLFLALAMLKEDGSFQTPKNTTPFIAQVKYCLRVIMLISVKRLARQNESQDLEACEEYQEWFTEKVDSTFNTVCTLQHYASSLAHQERGLPVIVWMDRINHRTMRFKGHTVEFEKLTTLFTNLENDAITLWEKDVLMGLPLRATYNKVTDNMGNTDVGYSFIFDQRNESFQDRDILAKAILADSALSKKFLTGLIDNCGQPMWKITELQKWLFNYSRFHAVQLTSADLKGGSPSRGTEINCIEYINSRSRQRGLYMIGDHLAIMCQYHKSASITGEDKLIPHSLDAVTSDLIIQDLAIARPFAELAAFICYPNNHDIQHRYHSYLFINNKRLFTTPQLTSFIQSYTLSVYNVSFGVADWRHISAAFRRKICPAVELAVEDDEMLDSIQALQSGHTRQTENHIYGITAEALAGAAEDVLPIYLDASTDWQVACQIVPGGHLLPYSEAKASQFAMLAASNKIKFNYSTPVTTMEQVTERVLAAINMKLNVQTKAIQEHMDLYISSSTKKLESLQENLNKTLEKISILLASSEQMLIKLVMVYLCYKFVDQDTATALLNSQGTLISAFMFAIFIHLMNNAKEITQLLKFL